MKYFEGWRLNKKIKSTVSVRSFTGTSADGMAHHVKECLDDISPDIVILYHGTKDLKSCYTSAKIVADMVNLALTIRSEKTKVFTIRNENLNKRRTEVNQILEIKSFVEKLSIMATRT